MDNRCYTVDFVGCWPGEQLHHGRADPYPSGYSFDRGGDQSSSGPQRSVAKRRGNGQEINTPTCGWHYHGDDHPDRVVGMFRPVVIIDLQSHEEHIGISLHFFSNLSPFQANIPAKLGVPLSKKKINIWSRRMV